MERETAIKILKELHGKSLFAERTALETLIPELKESEDERMSRELIAYFKNNSVYIKWSGLDVKKVIEWLEKQGKQPSAIRWYDVSLIPQEMEELLVEWDSEDATWHEIAFYHADTKTFWNGTRQVENVTRWCYIIDLLEKQDEKKPADKVEPRFKVGDWVVHNESGFVGQITKIIIFDDGFAYDHTNGYFHGCYEDNYHLWTIKDAKDGDVLVYGDNPNDHHIRIIMLFKSMRTYNSAFNHFHIFADDFRINDWCDCGKTAHPATKEQCDLLFEKMYEAGYEWDAEKKELKKIHVIDDGKAEMDYCFTKMMAGEKVSPAWSEEDEKMLDNLITYLDGRKDLLEDIKRVYVDWLKTLKPQNRWKPSDEQMEKIENLRHKWLLGDSAEAKYKVEAFDELIEMLKEE